MDNKVTIDDGLAIASGKCGPGIYTHGLAHLTVAGHLRLAPYSHLEHAVFTFTFDTDNILDRLGCDRAWESDPTLSKTIDRIRIDGTDLFDFIENLGNPCGQLF